MNSRNPESQKSLIRDKNGVIVLGQWPNFPLIGWLVSSCISWMMDGTISTGFSMLGTAFLFTWAYLELTSGVTYLRTILGGIVLGILIYRYF